MARSIRTEREAHAALAQTAQTAAQTRDDWRAVLAQRDARRDDRRMRNLRRAQVGAARMAHLFGAVLALVPVLGVLCGA